MTFWISVLFVDHFFTLNQFLLFEAIMKNKTYFDSYNFDNHHIGMKCIYLCWSSSEGRKDKANDI